MSDLTDPRYRVVVPLFVSYGRHVYQRRIALESRNISLGGLVFETSRKIPRAANTRVLVSGLGGLRSDARIEGRVAYREKNRLTGRYVVGVAFTRFVNVEPRELMKCIELSSENAQLTPI